MDIWYNVYNNSEQLRKKGERLLCEKLKSAYLAYIVGQV